jgi:hypothetical protein
MGGSSAAVHDLTVIEAVDRICQLCGLAPETIWAVPILDRFYQLLYCRFMPSQLLGSGKEPR